MRRYLVQVNVTRFPDKHKMDALEALKRVQEKKKWNF